MKSPDSRRHSYRVAPRRPRTAESDAGDRRLGAKSEGVRDVDAGARSSGAGAFRRSSVTIPSILEYLDRVQTMQLASLTIIIRLPLFCAEFSNDAPPIPAAPRRR